MFYFANVFQLHVIFLLMCVIFAKKQQTNWGNMLCKRLIYDKQVPESATLLYLVSPFSHCNHVLPPKKSKQLAFFKKNSQHFSNFILFHKFLRTLQPLKENWLSFKYLTKFPKNSTVCPLFIVKGSTMFER